MFTPLTLPRFWASTLGRGRPSWTQWCVMGCPHKTPLPPSGWSETCEGNLRKNSSEDRSLSTNTWLPLKTVKCSSRWSSATFLNWCNKAFYCFIFLTPSGPTCLCLCVTSVSPGPMGPRPLRTASPEKGCLDSTSSPALESCHLFAKR